MFTFFLCLSSLFTSFPSFQQGAETESGVVEKTQESEANERQPKTISLEGVAGGLLGLAIVLGILGVFAVPSREFVRTPEGKRFWYAALFLYLAGVCSLTGSACLLSFPWWGYIILLSLFLLGLMVGRYWIEPYDATK